MDALTTEPGTTELDATEPRLTELAALAGCTGKAGAGAVTRVLELLTSEAGSGLSEPAELLVGLRKPDDAAVYRLSDELALVLTVDFFAPIVDDPYDYGAISAANALSDVYTMGGEPALALNISGFPIEMSEQRLAAILRGGADKVPEAGAVIAGGHTIIDAEPKYGLCVIGFVHPDRLFAKGGARPGELLYLTKPIGTGLITTAAKFEEAEPAHLAAAIASMSTLNQDAARLACASGATALTDVTGFGLLGHGYELAAASDGAVRIDAHAVPLLPGAAEYAYRGVVTGGGARNREYLGARARFDDAVSEDHQHILFDPQTSGGLIFSVPPDRRAEVERRSAEVGVPVWRVGEVVSGHGVSVAA